MWGKPIRGQSDPIGAYKARRMEEAGEAKCLTIPLDRTLTLTLTPEQDAQLYRYYLLQMDREEAENQVARAVESMTLYSSNPQHIREGQYLDQHRQEFVEKLLPEIADMREEALRFADSEGIGIYDQVRDKLAELLNNDPHQRRIGA